MRYSSWKGQNLLFWRVLKKAWFKPFCSLYLRKKEEIEKSPRWRHLYEHKHLIDTVFDLISLTVWAVGGTAIDLVNFSRLLSLYFHAVCKNATSDSSESLLHSCVCVLQLLNLLWFGLMRVWMIIVLKQSLETNQFCLKTFPLTIFFFHLHPYRNVYFRGTSGLVSDHFLCYCHMRNCVQYIDLFLHRNI